MAFVGCFRLGREIHDVSPAIAKNIRRPEVLGGRCPDWLGGKRVAIILPVYEIRRARDLDVNPFALINSLRRIPIIDSVGRSDHGGVREVSVDHGIDISCRRTRDGSDTAGDTEESEGRDWKECSHHNIISAASRLRKSAANEEL